MCKSKPITIDELKKMHLENKDSIDTGLGSNAQGNAVLVTPTSQGFNIRTYQDNNWVRVDIYEYIDDEWIQSEAYELINNY